MNPNSKNLLNWMTIDDLTIVVCCNKNDFYLARICIASIRYYYPAVNTELIKDEGNGKFNSKEVERYFNVNLIDLNKRKLGWSGAKFHYLYQVEKGRKILMLDADIVFIGPFLERIFPLFESNDYVVSREGNLSNLDWVRQTYFDIDVLKKAYPDYVYPGYFFNAGQIFLTGGTIAVEILDEFFEKDKYPYWRRTDIFSMVDQSVYNYLLPTLASKGELKLATENFMIWAASKETLAVPLAGVIKKKNQQGLIHWAGCFRSPHVSKMLRGDILIFFEKYYYSKVKASTAKQYLQKVLPALKYHLKQVYYKLKPANL